MTRSSVLACLLVGLGACDLVPEPEPAPITRTVATSAAMLDPALTETFWDLPWPSDARRSADGTPDFTGFPNPEDSTLINRYLSFGQDHLDGFGTAAPIMFRFAGPVTLPPLDEAHIAASQRCEGPIRILDVDPASPGRGTCLPAQWRFIAANTADPFLAPDSVIVAPYFGFPMRGATTYAAYLVDIEGPGGFVQGSAALQGLVAGTGPADLQPAYQPFADHLALDALAAGEAAETPFVVLGQEDAVAEGATDLRWIAHATVFTTQDPTGELARIAEFVASEPGLVAWDGVLEPLAEDHDEFQELYGMWEGSYRAPNFQRGTLPYSEQGGGLVFADDGTPEVQLDEVIPFAMSMTREGVEQPANGWPLILHQHGTGGDRWSHLSGDGTLRPGLMGANRGFVSVGIPQPFHGDRWPGGNPTSISILSFNFNNPESGRSNFRQGAVDLFSLVRFVQENLTEGGAIATAHPELRIDPEQIYFLGHSQGGLTGALAIPFVDAIDGWVLSGAGGGLSITVMQREDPIVFRDLVLSALGDPPGTQLFELHPVLGLVQTLVDTTDPVNYAPLWIREAPVRAKSVLLTEGLLDDQTPADTAEVLAIAAGLSLAAPYTERAVFGLELRGLETLGTPFSGNAEGPDGTVVTAGLAQFDANHFAIFREGDAATLWANFLQSFARQGAPGELGYDP